jgi:hypothetical protein
MKQHTKVLSKKFINNLGTLNQDYVVVEKLGTDGKIHRNFVTYDHHAEKRKYIGNSTESYNNTDRMLKKNSF